MSTAKWIAIKSCGKIVGWMEMFWCNSLNGYVTIPGASRYRAVK